MRRPAGQIHRPALDAANPGDHADRQPPGFEHRPLLDMGLEVGAEPVRRSASRVADAGERVGHADAVEVLLGARVLEGRFTAVQQAVGTPKARTASAAFLAQFVEEAKASGLVARLIERHGVRGVSVAPVAPRA